MTEKHNTEVVNTIDTIQTAFCKRLAESSIPAITSIADGMSVERYFVHHGLYERILDFDSLTVMDTLMTMTLSDYIVDQFRPTFRRKGYRRMPEHMQRIVELLSVNCVTAMRTATPEGVPFSYYGVPSMLSGKFDDTTITMDERIMIFQNYTPEKLYVALWMYVNAIHNHVMNIMMSYPTAAYIPISYSQEHMAYCIVASALREERKYTDPNGGDASTVGDIIDHAWDLVGPHTERSIDSDLTPVDTVLVQIVEPALRAALYNLVSHQLCGINRDLLLEYIGSKLKTKVYMEYRSDSIDDYTMNVMITSNGDTISEENLIAQYSISYLDIIQMVILNISTYVDSEVKGKHLQDIGSMFLDAARKVMTYIISTSVEDYVAELNANKRSSKAPKKTKTSRKGSASKTSGKKSSAQSKKTTGDGKK